MDNKQQTGSAMSRVMNQMGGNTHEEEHSTMSISIKNTEQTRVMDARDIATKFVIDNMEYLQKLIDTVKPKPDPNNGEDDINPGTKISLSGEEAETLVDEFLEQHGIPTCCKFYFKLEACNGEKPIFVAANDIHATYLNAYIHEVWKHFNKEWSDPEEGLLSTISKIRKRSRALYNIQYIYPSKYDQKQHHVPLCCKNDHTRVYQYIDSFIIRDGTIFGDFLEAKYVNGIAIYHAPEIIKTMSELLENGDATLISFPEFISNLGKDIEDFKELCGQMTFWDRFHSRLSYQIMQFFIRAYDRDFKHLVAGMNHGVTSEESSNTDE